MPWEQLKAVSKITENENEILYRYYGGNIMEIG